MLCCLQVKRMEEVTISPINEKGTTPEIEVNKVVERADAVFQKAGKPRSPGKREMVCGLASDLVQRAAERYGIDCQCYQLRRVHRQLGSQEWFKDAFQHAFNIIRIGQDLYLADISFCQFIDPASEKISQNPIETDIRYQDSLVARELLGRGFFILNDQSLKDYLNISLAGSSDRKYFEEVTVDRLLSLDPKLITVANEHDPSRLDDYLDGRI